VNRGETRGDPLAALKLDASLPDLLSATVQRLSAAADR
jgi:hypothetical protein